MKTPRSRLVPMVGLLAFVAPIVLVMSAPPASAAVITVTTTLDGGPGSLRQAFADANTNGGANEIVLAADASYTLSDCGAGALTSTAGPLTITGNGATITQTCAGDGVVRQSSTTALTVTNVTITGGDASTGGVDAVGGGIRAAGAVTIVSSTISDNFAGYAGGGVHADGTATIVGSTLSNNSSELAGGVGAGSVQMTDSLVEGNESSSFGAVGAQTTSTVTRSTVRNNVGGGVLTLDQLDVLDSVIEGNTTNGGVSSAFGLVHVTGSLVKDNTGSEGAGVYNIAGGVLIEGSRITGNHASTAGGGVFVGEMGTIRGSTIDGNSAPKGGGVFADTVQLENTTVTGNSSGLRGGGVEAPQLSARFSTIAGNYAPSAANLRGFLAGSTASVLSGPLGGGKNCGPAPVSPPGGTYLYDDDGTCGLTTGTGNVSDGPDPLLGPLTDNGGPTPTRMPGFTSPLINAVPTGPGCLPTDQRGVSRPQFARCDIGAVEKDTSTGAGFHPVAPFRVLDTRAGTGGPAGPVVAGTPRDVVIGGVGSVPASASAVVMNVTATEGDAGSFLTVWPAGVAQPDTSTVNQAAGETIANLVTTGLGSGGAVSIANDVGSVEVVADVVGYFDVDEPAGSFYNATGPTRILDSRTSTGGWNGPLAAGAPRDLTITGPGATGSIPATATAVVANVTVTDGDAGSFLRVSPSGVAAQTSNVNFAPGQTIPNLVTVEIGANGQITFTNAVGAVDVVVDVVGYYDPTGGARFYPISPARVLDDRIDVGASGPWGPGETRTVAVAGAATAPAIPASASAVVTNLTATNATTGSVVSAYPAGASPPTSSTLNFGPFQTIANLAVIGVGTGGGIALSNELGTVDLIGDATGFYADY